MRSNLRKMWTALLAVTFVFAVAFGFVFAFTSLSVPRDAITADAVDGDFEVDDARLEGKTTYSYDKLNPQTWIYNPSSGQGYIDGTVTINGTQNSLWDRVAFITLLAYSDEACQNKVNDLRPLAAEADEMFPRYLRVQLVTENNETLLSDPFPITVTAAQPSQEAFFEPGIFADSDNQIYAAYTSFNEANAADMTVTIYYATESNDPQDQLNASLQVPYSGVDEEGRPVYGGYWIEYQDDEDADDRTDVFEMGDTHFYVCYREAGWAEAIRVEVSEITVQESPVNAPSPDNEGATLSNGTYSGKQQSFVFANFETFQSETASVTYTPNAEGWQDETWKNEADEKEKKITFTATEAGSFGVTFRAKTGYRYNGVPKAAAWAIYRLKEGTEQTYENTQDGPQGVPEGAILVGVTYEWSIQKATIGSAAVSNALPGEWDYGMQQTEPQAGDIALTTVPAIGSLTAASTTVFAEGSSPTLFYYSGTPNAGGSYGSTQLPQAAGEYTWQVKLSGMNNFGDFTGPAKQFTINSDEVALPALEDSEFPYDAENKEPKLVEESTLYGELSATPQKDVDTYEATLELNDADNYKWAVPEEGSGITVRGGTAVYTWKIVKSTNTLEGLAMSGWTWNEYSDTANAPSAAQRFTDNDGIAYTYHDSENGSEIEGELNGLNVGTYWVKAVSAATKNYDADTKWLSFTVSRAPLEKPSLADADLIYTGGEQSPVLADEYLENEGKGYYSLIVTKYKLVNREGETYSATIRLDGNHCWRGETGDAATADLTPEWTISPAEIGVEGALSIAGWTYGDEAGELKDGVTLDGATEAIVGRGGDAIVRSYTYYRVGENGDDSLGTTKPKDAGTYYVTVTLTAADNQYGVPNLTAKTVRSQDLVIEKDTLDFDPAPQELDWVWGTQESGIALNGFAPEARYGYITDGAIELDLVYYSADGFSVGADGKVTGGTTADVSGGFASLGVGSYTAYAYVKAGDNYNAGYVTYDFAVTKGAAIIAPVEIEGAGEWTYLDTPEEHSVSVTVTVEDRELASTEYIVTYYTRGWNESGGWVRGGTLTAVTLDDGSTVYRLPEQCHAGYYYIGVIVEGTENYDGAELGYTQGETNAFTVQKFRLDPEMKATDREIEFSAGVSQAPAVLIDITDGTVNSAWTNGAVVSGSYEEANGTSLTDNKPQVRGDYYVVLTIGEESLSNYEWAPVDPSTQLSGHEDQLSGAQKKFAFRITGALYYVEVADSGWTYGSTPVLPVVTPVAGGSGSSVTAEKSNELLNEALEEGASVTFFFYREKELLAEVTAYERETNGDGYTTLTIAGIPDAVMAAGTYTVRVEITPPEGGNYEARYATCGFTVSPYTLTENDIVWNTHSDLTYRGSAFSFDDTGSGSADITAEYKDWNYENGAYIEATGHLLLTPSGWDGEIKDWKEEGYSLHAALPEAESNVTLGDLTVQNTVEVAKRAVDVTLKEYHVTYRNAAFDGFGAQEGTHYSAEKAVTGTNTGLIDGEDLSIILTPSASAVDAGKYAYEAYTSANTNYTVTFNAAAEVFVIDKAEITVSIKKQSSIYGNPLADLTVTNDSTALYEISEGTLYDDANTVFSLTAMKDVETALGQGDGVDSYDIAGSVLTGEGGRGANYRVEFVNGEDAYSIAARDLKVSASVRNAIEYGDAAPTAFGDYLVTFDGAYSNDETALKSLLVFTPDGYSEGSAVGEYFVNVTFTEKELLGNYKISYTEGTEDVLCRPSFRVNAREIAVTIGNVTTEYGKLAPFEAALARVNGTGDAVLGKDTIKGAEGVAAYVNVFKLALVGHTHDADLAAGVYVIQGSEVSGNYAVEFKGETGGTTANYTVEPKTVDVTFAVVPHGSVTSPVFDGSAWEYTAKGKGVNGAVSFAVGYTYTGTENGLVNGRAVNAGSYTVGVVQAESGLFLSADGNYQTKTQPEPFSIARREVTVTWTEDDFTYNNTDQSSRIEAVYYPWKEGAETSAKTLTMREKPFFCDVREGGYIFTAEFGSGQEKQNYELVAGADYTAADNSASKVYTMKQAKIGVSIKPQASVYGEPLTDLTVADSTDVSTALYAIAGELYDNADTVFSLSLGTLSPTSDVGKYPITGKADGERAGNYRVDFEGGYEEDGKKGVYTIDYREVTVVFDDDYRAVYGTEETDGSLRKGVAFLREGSGENVFVFDTDGAAALDAVAFEVTGGGAYGETSAAGSEWTVTPVIREHALSNYAFIAEAGRMTVDPRPVTVALSPVEVQYGEKGTLDVTSVTYTGSETLPAVIASDLLAGDGETEVSRYANVFTLSLYQKNDLSSPITADYASLDRGSYVISVTGSDGSSPYRSGNYLITFQTAGYEVAAKTIGVQLVLDGDGHSYEELTYDGLAWGYIAYGDDGGRIEEEVTFAVTYFNSVNGAASGEALAGAPVNAGSYIAVVDTGELDKDGNYSAQGRFAVPFSIARREVTVTWTEDDFTYNNTDQSGRIEAFYLPWENGAQLSEGSEVKLGIEEIEFKDCKEGGYTFTAKFASEQEKQNYRITGAAESSSDRVTKTYSMKRAEIAVSIKPQASVYGEPLTALTVADSTSVSTALYTIAGELYDNADTVFSLTAMKDALTALEQGDGVGSYDIAGSVLTGEGGRGANYQVKFENADVPTSLVGTYAIERRPVRIVLQDFETIYGTNLSLPDAHGKLVTLSRLAFANGDDTTGSAILEGDVNTAAAAAEAMRFAFADGYGQTSAAGTKWTVTAGLADSDAPELKNYTFVTGANGSSSMTVIPRPVTVELPKPAASYTYGTRALGAASGTFKATETIGSAWAEYGDAIVLNENAEGGVYTLVVKNENGEEVMLSAMTPAGSYTLEGKAGGNTNYAVTFSQAETFLVAKADFVVNDPAQEVSVTYTGEHYYFREEAASGDDNAASDPLFGHTLSVTTTGLALDADDIEYTWTFTVASASVTYLAEAGEYTVGYTVKAENFNDVSGSFIVVIGIADNEWTSGVTMEDGGTYRHAGWTYGDPYAYPGLGWTETFSGYAPAVPFEARYGDPVTEYYKTRTGDDESGYTYSDKIEDPDTFFCCETQAGTYYVRVYVAETDDWKGLTAHGTIHVGQRAVDIDWAASNITVDPVTHEGKNRTIGFDNTLMTVDMHSLPQGLTIYGDPNDEGFEDEIEVTVTAEGTTQFYLFFELVDAENYCWELSETVTGDHGDRIQISFTTDAFQNNVVFYGKNGQADQDTGISVAYGTELTYRFAQSEGESIGDAQLLIFVDSTLKGETESSYVSFAFAAEDDTEPRDNSYTIASLSGADAGFYWLRVQVYPMSDSGYGYGVGYLKIEIEAREVTQAEIDGIDFGIDPQTDTISFVYDGTAHQPSEEHVPAYLNVSFDTMVTDVGEAATEVRAIFTIADGSYMFEGGAKQLERTLKVIVAPSEIERIVWSVREYTYNGKDQLDEVYAYFIDVFGHEHRLKVEAEGGEFLNATAEGVTFTALCELYDTSDSCSMSNYAITSDTQNVTHVFTMAKRSVHITLQPQTFVYSGGAPEIEQTAFSVNGFDYEIAETMGLYKELFAGGLTIAANSQTFGVGSYAINLGGYDGLSNYDVTPVNAQLTITPKQLTFRWPTVENDVFGGSIDGVTLTGEEFEGLIEGYDEIEGFLQVVYEGTSWSGNDCGGALPKEAGEYTVTVRLSESLNGVRCNYALADAGSRIYKIEKQTVEEPSVAPKTYTGELLTADIAENALYRVQTNAGGTDAGSYDVVLRLKDGANHRWATTDSAEVTLSFVIEKATLDVTVDLESWVFGEEGKDLILGGDAFPGVPAFRYTSTDGKGYDDWHMPENAGKYRVTVYIRGMDNYVDVEISCDFEIEAAEYAFTVTMEGWTYGERANAPVIAYTNDPPLPEPSDDIVRIEYAPLGADGGIAGSYLTDIPTDAGSYRVRVTVGTEGGNYVPVSGTADFTIKKATFAFTVTMEGWTYGERANAPVYDVHPEGAAATVEYATVNGGSAADIPASAGSYIVRVTYAESANYALSSASAEFVIAKAPIAAGLEMPALADGGFGWVAGEAPDSVWWFRDGFVPEGEVSAAYEGMAFDGTRWDSDRAPEKAGVYKLQVTIAESANHLGAVLEAEFTLTRGEFVFTVSVEGWTYGENANAPVLTCMTEELPAEAQVSYLYRGTTNGGEAYESKNAPVQAGSYTLTVTLTGMDGYADASAVSDEFVVSRAGTVIDTSGVRKQFVYTGKQLSVTSGATLNHGETQPVYSNNTFTAVGTYTVKIEAPGTNNYEPASATVTVTVSKAALGFTVSIDDWTYGETPSRYVISGLADGAAVTVWYSGLTNAGENYSSSAVPTEAGDYTIRATAAASGSFEEGAAYDSFSILRADPGASLSLESWYYGDKPNEIVLTPDFLMDEPFGVTYSDGVHYSAEVPSEVGRYTATVRYAQTDNYRGGELTVSFEIMPRSLGLSVSIEGWTYGDEPNAPVVTGADLVGLVLTYTGTANDGTTWNSNTAPYKAGSYRLTVTAADADNYTNASASVGFTVARRLLTAPSWDGEGLREIAEEHNGGTNTIAVVGFDASLMNVSSDGAQFVFGQDGGVSAAADRHGIYEIYVSLKDTANYGWIVWEDGGNATDTAALVWQLTEHVISLLWLIILLAVLVLIALIVLIVLLKKNANKKDGGDGGEEKLASAAPVGLLLAVAPIGQIVAVVLLGFVLAGLVAADIVLGVRLKKGAETSGKAENNLSGPSGEA